MGDNGLKPFKKCSECYAHSKEQIGSSNINNSILAGLRPAISPLVVGPQAPIYGPLTPQTSKILRWFFISFLLILKRIKILTRSVIN